MGERGRRLVTREGEGIVEEGSKEGKRGGEKPPIFGEIHSLLHLDYDNMT